MTAPTHLAGSVSLLLLAAVALRCIGVSTYNVLIVMFFGLFPDVDNPKSIIGWLARRLLLIVSFGQIDIAKLFEHRGFFHSLTFCLFMTAIAYFAKPSVAGLVFIGMFSHIVLDTFQKQGVKLLGFGNYWARFSTKWHIPLYSAGEYSFLASCLLVILVCSLIISNGGTNHLIRQALGTIKASAEDISEMKGYESFLVIDDGRELKEYPVIDALGDDTIIILDEETPVSFGFKKGCHIRADSKSFVRKGKAIDILLYRFVIRNTTLRELYSRIDPAYFYFFSGSIFLSEPLDVPSFHNRYNTITGSGRKYCFEYARLDDLRIYGLEDAEIVVGDFEVTYRVSEGQYPARIEKKISEASSAETDNANRRIAELKKLIEGSGAKEAQEIFGVSEEQANTYSRFLKEKAKELLVEEEANLLRIRSLRKD